MPSTASKSLHPHRVSMPAVLRGLLICRQATTAIEFALLAPALFLFLLGIVEFGRALWTLNALHYSVQEAARCASIDAINCGNAQQIQAFAAGRSGAGFASSVFTASTASCGNKISASYAMHLYIPYANYSVTLTAQSCYPI